MKILHLDTRPDWRGGQHQILMTLRGLRERGHDAQLLTRRDSALQERAVADKFTVHTFPPRFARLNALLCLREIVDQQHFDVVHAHDPHALSAAWLARVHRRSALVVSRRVAYPLSRGWPGLARYRAAHRIIAVSRFVAKSVIAAGIDPSCVGVVYDGVEIPPVTSSETRSAARRRWNIADGTMLVGCVGYLLPEKGQELLVRAMKIVLAEFPACKLILAGDGPLRARLESLAAELALRNAIIFAGFVEDTDALYQALDIFAFPSLAEPLGSSLLAAMAHGLPAIAVASGGVPEIIEGRRDGVLVDAPDAIELANAICRLLRDPQTARRIGDAARETIARRFTANFLAENTLHEYELAIRTFGVS
ncbi:MAG: glycosyltransferase family 4 protein [Candidatus Acidiferrales bacterium]